MNHFYTRTVTVKAFISYNVAKTHHSVKIIIRYAFKRLHFMYAIQKKSYSFIL
jgi:hypothetical protein